VVIASLFTLARNYWVLEWLKPCDFLFAFLLLILKTLWSMLKNIKWKLSIDIVVTLMTWLASVKQTLYVLFFLRWRWCWLFILFEIGCMIFIHFPYCIYLLLWYFDVFRLLWRNRLGDLARESNLLAWTKTKQEPSLDMAMFVSQHDVLLTLGFGV
jgi:hypothetical protein